ncbi:hydantoinase B/oxoprolinase family protein [Streptomyces sp. NPDC003442]
MDNNPYGGNSHAADHSVLVPVFIDGEHMFTAVAKAHQIGLAHPVPARRPVAPPSSKVSIPTSVRAAYAQKTIATRRWPAPHEDLGTGHAEGNGAGSVRRTGRRSRPACARGCSRWRSRRRGAAGPRHQAG